MSKIGTMMSVSSFGLVLVLCLLLNLASDIGVNSSKHPRDSKVFGKRLSAHDELIKQELEKFLSKLDADQEKLEEILRDAKDVYPGLKANETSVGKALSRCIFKPDCNSICKDVPCKGGYTRKVWLKCDNIKCPTSKDDDVCAQPPECPDECHLETEGKQPKSKPSVDDEAIIIPFDPPKRPTRTPIYPIRGQTETTSKTSGPGSEYTKPGKNPIDKPQKPSRFPDFPPKGIVKPEGEQEGDGYEPGTNNDANGENDKNPYTKPATKPGSKPGSKPSIQPGKTANTTGNTNKPSTKPGSKPGRPSDAPVIPGDESDSDNKPNGASQPETDSGSNSSDEPSGKPSKKPGESAGGPEVEQDAESGSYPPENPGARPSKRPGGSSGGPGNESDSEPGMDSGSNGPENPSQKPGKRPGGSPGGSNGGSGGKSDSDSEQEIDPGSISSQEPGQKPGKRPGGGSPGSSGGSSDKGSGINTSKKPATKPNIYDWGVSPGGIGRKPNMSRPNSRGGYHYGAARSSQKSSGKANGVSSDLYGAKDNSSSASDVKFDPYPADPSDHDREVYFGDDLMDKIISVSKVKSEHHKDLEKIADLIWANKPKPAKLRAANRSLMNRGNPKPKMRILLKHTKNWFGKAICRCSHRKCQSWNDSALFCSRNPTTCSSGPECPIYKCINNKCAIKD